MAGSGTNVVSRSSKESAGGIGRLTRGRRGRAARTIRQGELRTAALFIAPALALYALFMLIPFANSIYFSLTNWNGATALKEFVGLDNYIAMFRDPTLYLALRNNVVWIVLGTAAPVVLGLMLALVLWTVPRGALFFRTVFFLPFILPIVVVGLVWGWIYHPLFGVLNRVLATVGLESLGRGWLGDASTALVATLVAAIWGAFGFVTVLLYTALQNVNTDMVDAAKVDGATWFERARFVVIPAIAPVLTLVTAITLIGGFAVFDFILIMTGGGPGNASTVLGYYAYENGFELNRLGYGSALSMFITVLSLVAAVAFVKFRERER